MTNKKHYFIKKMLLFIIIPLFIFSITNVSLASTRAKHYSHLSGKHKKSRKNRHKRRTYNPTATRAQTIEFIKANSDELSALAGLQPNPDDSTGVQTNTHNESNIDEEEGENISELEADDDVAVDMESFRIMWLSYMDDGKEVQSTQGGLSKKDIMQVIMDWVGTPYRFGSRSRLAIDCSAFTQSIFREAVDVNLPRTAREQYNVGMRIPNRNDLQFGDLIFFHTYSRKFASHVGIYLGDDLFAHASSRYGVTVSSLESTYYKEHFIGGRRISVTDMVRSTQNLPDLENGQ
ncbi:MAG: C40 family peptidase [FCB group bacterium]